MRHHLLCGLLAAASAAVSLTAVPASAGLLVQYNFEEGSGTTASSSTATAAPLTLAGGAAFSALGGGVNGTGYALRLPDGGFGDNRAANTTAGDISVLGSLTSYTLTGWYNRTANLGSSGRLLSFGPSGASVDLTGTGAGSWQFGSVFSSAAAQIYYDDLNSWVFVAVTVDTTATTNNVKFYEGTIADGVRAVGTYSLTTTATGAAPTSLVVGNRPDFARAFGVSSVDDIRIYGETSGSTGALALSDLETIRSSAVPEPAALGLLGLSLTALLRRRR